MIINCNVVLYSLIKEVLSVSCISMKAAGTLYHPFELLDIDRTLRGFSCLLTLLSVSVSKGSQLSTNESLLLMRQHRFGPADTSYWF